jgi:hypothetical protein
MCVGAVEQLTIDLSGFIRRRLGGVKGVDINVRLFVFKQGCTAKALPKRFVSEPGAGSSEGQADG